MDPGLGPQAPRGPTGGGWGHAWADSGGKGGQGKGEEGREGPGGWGCEEEGLQQRVPGDSLERQ